MNRAQIMDILPHRDPFLLVDEVLELEPGVRIKAQYHVAGNEYFFPGHFPRFPVMPGVLIIEALAQAGAIAILALSENEGKIGYLTGVDKARFRRKVVPGDTLTLELFIEKYKLGMGVGQGVASVDGQKAASATIKFALGE